MPVTTPHTGVRVFQNRIDTTPITIADMSTIGGVFTPGQNCDRTLFPPDVPVHFTTDDAQMVAGCGTGSLRQQVNAATAEGVVASIVAVVPDIGANDDAAFIMAKLAGLSAGRTGAWALLDAQGECGAVPDILVSPGYTALRPGDSANPIATAFDAIAERLVTPVAVCDAPMTDKTAAVEWAADFSESKNIIAVAQGVRISENGLPVIRPSSASIAALMVATDKNMGGPYYNPGNQSLAGILGPSRAVGFSISDPGSEANFLLQRGVNSIVQLQQNRTARAANAPQGKTFWGFFTTCSDPLWRSINVIRTRKAICNALPQALVRYTGKNLGAHLAVAIKQSLDEFLLELQRLPEPAILPGANISWNRAQNGNAFLRVGGLSFSANWEEAPPLLDLQIYTGRNAASFDILASEIQAAMARSNVTGVF